MIDKLTSIIILTYNNLQMTEACIKSLLEFTSQVKTPFEIIVVDNHSTDGTVNYLKGLESSGQIKVIYNRENKGFPAGNNQAAQIAQGEYLCLLNNDIILTEEWLEKLMRAIRSDPQLAAVGPYANFTSGRQMSPVEPSYRNNKELQQFALKYSQEEKYTDFLVFFCCLIRRKVWDELGGLSEKMGVGCWEDNLFCWKAIDKGYRLKVVGNCYVYHHGSQTFGVLERKKELNYQQLIARNQKIFLKLIDKYRTISLCMIVSQEERPEVLDRCLASIAEFVDEICININWKFLPNRGKIKRLEKVIRKYSNILEEQHKEIDVLLTK